MENKVEIKPGVVLKYRHGMSEPDSRPGFKSLHWGDVRVLRVRGQNVDLEQMQNGKWQDNGLVSSIPHLQRLQSEYKEKVLKLSELRQIIREEIQKELLGLGDYGRGGLSFSKYELEKNSAISSNPNNYYVFRTMRGEWPKSAEVELGAKKVLLQLVNGDEKSAVYADTTTRFNPVTITIFKK